MGKLEIIKEALHSNPNVTVIKTFNMPFSQEHGIVHVINYYVAPKNGLYTVDELQDFMKNLIPGLAPTSKEDFRQYNNNLKLGLMYFDEKIGEKKINITEIVSAAPEEKANLDWLVPSKKNRETTEEYSRRIWITVTPSEAIGNALLMDKFRSGSWIKLEDIAKYRDAKESTT